MLPFVDFSPGQKSSRFGTELAADLRNVLTREGGWQVSGPSPLPAEVERSGLESVCRQLKVATVLEGSVSQVSNKLRITAQLVNTADGYHLWTGTYEKVGPASAELSHSIASSISGQRTQWAAKLTGNGADGMQARELTSSGRRLIRRGTEDHLAMRGPEQERSSRLSDVMTAVQGFERAILLDPQYAPAYGGLAGAYALGANFDDRLWEKAREAAIRGLEVDETLPEAHFVIGYSKFLREWDFAGARAELKRTLELDPRNVTACRLYADCSALVGDPDSGFAALRQGQRLVPDSPVMAVQFGIMLYHARRFEELSEHARALQKKYPSVHTAY